MEGWRVIQESINSVVLAIVDVLTPVLAKLDLFFAAATRRQCPLCGHASKRNGNIPLGTVDGISEHKFWR